MSEEGDVGTIAGDFAEVLDDPSRPPLDRILKLTTAVVAVNPMAKRVAGRDVGFDRWPHVVARQAQSQRPAVELRDRLARFEAELHIQTEGTIVISGLQQPDAGNTALRAALDYLEHQPAAD